MKPSSAIRTPPFPAYTLRRSSRARRISLRVVPGRGLEVVLPQGVDASCVPHLMHEHRRWIERTLARMELSAAPCAGSLPPGQVLLRGGRELVRLRYSGRNAAQRAVLCPADDGVPEALEHSPPRSGPEVRRDLALPAFAGDLTRCPEPLFRWLRQWARREARERLGGMLALASRETGLSFSSCGIRLQKTRWGSCSSSGHISLNAALLFLPDPLTRYVLLHELCHTREMNHSQRFWKLLFSFDPQGLEQDGQLRTGWRHVPFWMFG